MINIIQAYKERNFLKTNIGQVSIGIGLLMIVAQISVPLHPVPVTFQPEAVMLIGLLYSRECALKAVGGYLLLAALGFPVCANYTGGLYKFMGPTGGYLVGLYMAVWAMTTLRQHFNCRSGLSMIGLCMVGKACIFLCGVGYLSTLLGVEKALMGGLLPFILPGIIKSSLLVGALRYIQKG